MNKKNHMDLSFVEDVKYSSGRYQPFDMLATSKSLPLMVMCSRNADPPEWRIVGSLFSVHFLSYKDMEQYIAENGIERWSKKHERNSGIHLSASNCKHPFIF
ncbi:MAG: hypothetical protein RR967_01870 [Anaerovoracaceae bacterium]